MNREQNTEPERRRSTRLENQRQNTTGTPGSSQAPAIFSTFEEEIVVVTTVEGGLQAQVEEVVTVLAEPEPDSEDSGQEEEASSEEMAPSTRLKYEKFKGDGQQDVDDWLGEFESTALANEEVPASKHRIFQGLLKGEALKWYQDLSEEVKDDWHELIPLFLRTFREAGGEARALGRLSKIAMKPQESVRRYGQRMKALLQKLTTEIAPSIQVEWYVAGLPEEMGFQIRQTRPRTLRETMEAAQNYENSAQSLRNSLRRSERDGKKKSRLKEIRRRRKNSDTDSSGTGNGSGSSESDPGTSESEYETSKRHSARSRHDKNDRAKVVVKVKREEDESKKVLKGIQESLEAIRVNLAENRKPRKLVPTSRANVWCSRCGEAGHYASECPNPPQKRVHYIDPEDGVYYTFPEEEQEPEVYPVYQVQPVFGRGKAPPHLIRTDTRPVVGGSSQGMMQPQFLVICYACGRPGHYANNCPFKGQGQGAPLALPCQNCGEYGHTLQNCPKPLVVRPVYQQVEVPPREQTGLNYGHTAGVEKPDK